MRLLPPPEATAPTVGLKARLLGLLYVRRWSLAWLAGSAAFGLFCRSLPEGAWRDFCMMLAAGADQIAGWL